MADQPSPLTEASVAAEAMRKLHYRRAYLQISSNVIRFLTTLTIAAAPIYLAFAEQSFRMLFLWLLYPAAVLTQRLFSSDDNPRPLVWGLAVSYTHLTLPTMS